MELFYCGNQWGYTPLGTTVNIPSSCSVPTGLSALVENQYITFRWQAPHDYHSFILYYRVANSAVPFTEQVVYGTAFKATLQGETAYEWMVATVCRLSPFSGSAAVSGANVTTGKVVADCVAIGLPRVTNDATEFKVSWDSTNALYYVVHLRIKGTTVVLQYTTQETFHVFKDLVEGSQYEVMVVSYCRNNTTSSSIWVAFNVGTLTCPKPGVINTTSSVNSIVASWFPAGVGVFTYNVYLNGELIAAQYPHTSFSFVNLPADSPFDIDVRTNCSNGYSDKQSKAVRTLPAPCAEPTGLKIENQSGSSVSVSWTPAAGISEQQIVINNSEPITLFREANSYSFNNLPGGSHNRIVVRSVCSGKPTAGVSIDAIMTGCQPPSILRFDRMERSIKIMWDAIPNAVGYQVKVTEVATAVLKGNYPVAISEAVIEGLNFDTNYRFEVVAFCGPERIASAPATADARTIAQSVCENAVIDEIIKSQTTITVKWRFASGRTTGFIVANLRDNTNGVNQMMEFSQVRDIEFVNLIPGAEYHLFIYVNENGCNPQPVQIFNHVAACSTPVITSATYIDNDTVMRVEVAADASAQSYSLEYQLAGEDNWYVPPGTIAFPYNLALPAKGKYRVRVRKTCTDGQSEYAVSGYLCPKPTNVSAAANGGGVEITWDKINGVDDYRIIVKSLTHGEKTYATTTNSIIITDLPNNSSFVVTIGTICSANPDVVISSDAIPFTTTPANTQECSPAVFSAVIQNCDNVVTQPPAQQYCSVEPRDWNLYGASFIPIDEDDSNDTFFEATFEISQSLGAGVDGLLPGGIMGFISQPACRPLATASLELTIEVGGTTMVGTAQVYPNGNITGSASYTSDGRPTLVVRVRGKFNKV